MPELEAAALVLRAAAGDAGAWEETVARYSGLLWAVARSHRLSEQAAADVVQTVWLRLLEHIGEVHTPEHIGGWLATTARREALRTIRSRWREEPAPVELWERDDPAADAPDAGMLRQEEHARLLAALAHLPARQRRLLRVLSADPPPSYAEVSAALRMPVGSIGPTPARALSRLRSLLSDDAGRQVPAGPAPAPAARPAIRRAVPR